MRSVLVCLLLANVAYCLWNIYWQPHSAPTHQLYSIEEDYPLIQLLAPQEVVGIDEAEGFVEIVPEPRKCFSVGPFDQRSNLLGVYNLLIEQGLQAMIFQNRMLVVKNWVIVPPLDDFDAAYGLLQGLKEVNLDSYVISEGDYKHGISLGLFAEQSLALELKSRMAGLGYDVVIIEIEQKKAQYWVKLTNKISLQRLADLVPENIFSAKILESSCEKFASPL